MNYDYISYMSYDSKKDMIKLENNVEISRQSIYYHTSVYSEAFLKTRRNQFRIT